MADPRRFELDELVNRPGTYFNPQPDVLGQDGHVHVRQDPFLPAAALLAPVPTAPARHGLASIAAAASRRPHHRRRPRPKPPATLIAAALGRLLQAETIDQPTNTADLA